jgi:hypothetical protein
MRRLRLWGMGSRLLDELRFFAFGGGVWWVPGLFAFAAVVCLGAWGVGLFLICLPVRRFFSVCLERWAFLDLFACEALFFCVPGALAFS